MQKYKKIMISPKILSCTLWIYPFMLASEYAEIVLSNVQDNWTLVNPCISILFIMMDSDLFIWLELFSSTWKISAAFWALSMKCGIIVHILSLECIVACICKPITNAELTVFEKNPKLLNTKNQHRKASEASLELAACLWHMPVFRLTDFDSSITVFAY